MTQAFNLSQLANNVNTSGQLNAAVGLYNQTPVANGGTGVATVAAGNILVGAGTAAMTALAGSATNDVVTWDGTAWVSAAAAGGAVQTYLVRTTPGTWTKTPTIKGIKVTVVGGGGNGGAATAGPTPATASSGAGGGGGGGASIRLYPAASLPGPQPYTVGGAGASSSFGVAPATVISATGGTAGGPSASGSGNDGGAGGIGSSGNANIGGGGGGWGDSQLSSKAFGAQGGNSILGGGGVSVRMLTPGPIQPGQAGRAYGGGGGGGASFSSGGTVVAPGGAGAAGVVIIEEFY